MKRMHELPIEMPLIASGEFDRRNASFKLDTDLKKYDNKILMFLIIDESNDYSFSGILNMVNIQNKNIPRNCYSSVFTIKISDTIFESDILFAPYDEDPIETLYVISIGKQGETQPVGDLVIYLYELPITHKDF